MHFFIGKKGISSRAQSVMEFFMTYGWLALALLIILGVLIYLGFFNVETPSELNIIEPVEASDFRVTGSSIDFVMKISQEAESAEITGITLNGVSCVQAGGSLYNTRLTSNLSVSGCRSINPPLKTDKKVRGEIYVNYQKRDGGIHALKGGYSSVVESGTPILCGNGELNSGEECDDRNLEKDDGCSPVCRRTHRQCDAQKCITVSGAGADECSSSIECLA
jgi:cysteine-rich repeat protein